MLAALGAITCLLRGTVGEIAAAPGGADLARQMLDECAAVAIVAGFPPEAAFRARTEAMLTATGSGLASSMYRDLTQGLPVEAEQIVGDMLVRARGFGVAAPLLGPRRPFDGLSEPDGRALTARVEPGSRSTGGSASGSTSTSAPSGTACVISIAKPDIMVKSASAAPCTMIGLTVFSTSAAGDDRRAPAISCSIQAVATPPFAASSTRMRPT